MQQLPMKSLVLLVVTALALSAVAPASNDAQLQAKLRGTLQSYLNERGSIERITAASVSVNAAGDAPIAVAAGANPSSLFQIGSNTKAFTATIALQLEAEHKLRIDDPIGPFLPQYPAWKHLTIRRLLNMTSGIETYDNTLAFQRYYASHPYHNFTAAELISYVYPKNGKATFMTGWHYANTGYILTQLVIERVTGKRYADVLRERIFNRLHLRNAYYYPHALPTVIRKRLVAGYFYSNDPDNAGLQPIYNHDVADYTLSWTQAAGGIVATPADVTRWAQALYSGELLPAAQHREMMTLVSQKTGKPIAGASPENSHGFGLGVGELYKPPLGRIWFYEGETLGYRVLHAFLPEKRTIITVALNSQPNASEDHIGDLLMRVLADLR
jgi:D-alanyl-D-alanine carboxypeptidase